MAGNLEKRGWLGALVAGVVAVPLLAGCSGGPGGGTRFTLFPDSGTLMEVTRAVRQPVHPPPPVPRELDKRLLPPYTVAPGDSILVRTADINSPVEIAGTQPILLDGTVSLGRYGPVIVAGKTIREMEMLIRSIIQAQDKDHKDPGPIVVQIVNRVSKVYYVVGEVNAPGAFPVQGRETVLDGILAAGGLTDRASRVNIVLARPTAPDSCRVVLPVCYRNIVQLGDTTTNYQLAPGDRIYVGGRGFHESMFGPDHKKAKSPCECGLQTACPLAPDDHGPHFPDAAPSLPPVIGVPTPNAPLEQIGPPLSH